MALATRCPNCQALFRVAPDQLKLRGGVVRCGSCRHVFDAIGTLSYLDDAALTSSATASPPAAVDVVIAAIRKAESTVGDAMRQDDASTSDEERSAEETSVATAERREETFGLSDGKEQPVATESNDALIGLSEERRPTQFAEPEAEAPARGDATAAEVEAAWTLEPAPLAGSDEPGAEAAKPVPSFLSNARAPRKRGSRMLRGAAAALLALLALAQLAVAFRSDIVAVLPQARPALGQLCRLFRCTVGWPTRADLLAVVGTELQLLPGAGALELTAIVRNRGPMTLELPAIELTLSDTLNRTVARRIFTPVEYLAGDADPRSQIEAGLAAGADLTVRVAFEARGINAAGFVVYPFYL